MTYPKCPGIVPFFVVPHVPETRVCSFLLSLQYNLYLRLRCVYYCCCCIFLGTTPSVVVGIDFRDTWHTSPIISWRSGIGCSILSVLHIKTAPYFVSLLVLVALILLYCILVYYFNLGKPFLVSDRYLSVSIPSIWSCWSSSLYRCDMALASRRLDRLFLLVSYCCAPWYSCWCLNV